MAQTDPTIPTLWRPGATIGLMSPSSPADEARTERGIAWLRDGGAWAPRSVRPLLDRDDPRSGVFDGGGHLADYLAAVHAEVRTGT